MIIIELANQHMLARALRRRQMNRQATNLLCESLKYVGVERTVTPYFHYLMVTNTILPLTNTNTTLPLTFSIHLFDIDMMPFISLFDYKLLAINRHDQLEILKHSYISLIYLSYSCYKYNHYSVKLAFRD